MLHRIHYSVHCQEYTCSIVDLMSYASQIIALIKARHCIILQFPRQCNEQCVQLWQRWYTLAAQVQAMLISLVIISVRLPLLHINHDHGPLYQQEVQSLVRGFLIGHFGIHVQWWCSTLHSVFVIDIIAVWPIGGQQFNRKTVEFSGDWWSIAVSQL